ncbi:hypothetical protein H5410_060539 [Solanum commersonii]|uniref:Uncharacterized protein n=1 Tax=Solanum commersonii TaxID=4109 RepID=A0A9J5W5C2_SOLCO|nr:hypothetical protein H5410_060539 [Solanum commersonii]
MFTKNNNDSNTPIIPEEVYEIHYGNYQENEEVEIDEEDLDDTPTSPNFNSIAVPPQEDNPPVGTSRPPIVSTRDSSIGASARGSNMVQDIKPEEQPDLVTCQNSIKLLANEIDDGMELQDHQRALPRPVVDYG